MNEFQELWWQQAQSDFEMFQHLQSGGFAQCHQLHYLQMASEKIAKAYLWRDGKPVPRKHTALVKFMNFLCQHIRSNDRDRIAGIFGFTRYSDFKHSIKSCVILAHNIENLSPDLANDGPNPEYPWPHAVPANSPVNHNFPIWSELKLHQGRKFQKFIQRAIQQFSHYADI